MSLIWTPGGMLNTEREVTRLPPEYLKMLAVLAETSGDIDLGLHCSRCKENVQGKNARGDNQWRMECSCRTFIGGNPLPKAH